LFNACAARAFASPFDPLRPFFSIAIQLPTHTYMPRRRKTKAFPGAGEHDTRIIKLLTLQETNKGSRVDLFAAEVEQISPRNKKLNSNLFVSIVSAGNN
jgi:hypothetical protein